MKAWPHDAFFQYPRTAFPTSEGNVELPILYYDDSTLFAMFRVDYQKAQALAAPQGLDAIRLSGDKALVAMAFYEYRETSIASYNEVGVAIAVVPQGRHQPLYPMASLFRSVDRNVVGWYVIDLPVTTAAACAAGRELWGYPKFVTGIGFVLRGDRFTGTVADPNGPGNLLTLEGEVGVGVPGPLLDLVLYSPHKGKMLRTLVQTRGGGRLCLPGSIRLDVAESGHPMVQRLRSLGLGRARPFIVSHSHALQLRLNAGAELP